MSGPGSRPRRSFGDRATLVFLTLFGAVFAAVGVLGGTGEAREALARGDRSRLLVSLGGGALFVLFGAGVVALAVFAARRRAPEPPSSETPWLARPEWAAGRVSSRSGAAAALLWVMAVVWNGISAPLTLLLPREAERQGNPLVWLGLLFPLVGIGLLVWAVRQSVRWRKFGSSILELKTLPGVVGGRFEAALQLRRPLDASELELTLECVHRSVSGSGRNRTTQEHALWQKRARVPRSRFGLGPTGTSIPVGFTVPYDCEPTRDTGTANEILWRLGASAHVAGVDYQARFEVPVFRTAESSPEVTGDDEVPEVAVTSLAGGEALPGSRVRLRPWGAGGLELWFGPLRNPAIALVLGICALAAGAATALLAGRGAPLFPLGVSGFFAGCLGLATLVHCVGATRVRVAPGVIQVSRGVFGLGRRRTWRSGELSGIAVRRGSQYGSHLYWDIVIEVERPAWTRADGTSRTRRPRRFPAGSRLPSQDEARALARALARRFGLADA